MTIKHKLERQKQKLFIRSPTLLPSSGNNPVPSVSVFLLNLSAIKKCLMEVIEKHENLLDQ